MLSPSGCVRWQSSSIAAGTEERHERKRIRVSSRRVSGDVLYLPKHREAQVLEAWHQLEEAEVNTNHLTLYFLFCNDVKMLCGLTERK